MNGLDALKFPFHPKYDLDAGRYGLSSGLLEDEDRQGQLPKKVKTVSKI